jgi:excisionase family DNA binding protein
MVGLFYDVTARVNHDEVFTVPEIAKALKCSKSKVYQWVQEGKVKRCPLPDDSMVRIPRAELDRLLGVTHVKKEDVTH